MAEWRSGHQNLRVLYGTAYNVPKLLPGSSYATLRSMFQNVPYYGQAKSVKNVLISTCGADSLHLMKIFLESFLMPKFTYYLLSGHLNTDKKEIWKLVAGRENINLHENVNNMRGLFTGMDIAVSTAGSTIYEIAAYGVPLVIYVLAYNQIHGVEAFDRLGLAIDVGDIRENSLIGVQMILKAIEHLTSSYETRCEIGNK